MHWHQREIEDVFTALGSSPAGLSPEAVESRLSEYGPNELKEKKKRTLPAMFLDQFKDFMIIVLIAAAVISGFIGEMADTIAIIVIVLLNAVIGFVQEYRAEKAMAALKRMTAPFAVVIRDGKSSRIRADGLVPGDVVLLEAGSIVPADLRLTELSRLKVEEAPLTGESVPVSKSIKTLHVGDLPVGDRLNLAFNGTHVTYGRATGVVVATGMATEIGNIASMLQEGETKTPLQKRLANFGKKLAGVILAVCAVVFAIGILRGEPAMLMLLTAISLAVAAIPEALPAVVTISLALGARKLVVQNALIRKLPAVETLGSVTYICSDKTGTLTMNKMAVEELYVDGRLIKRGEGDVADILSVERGAPAHIFLAAMAISNDAHQGADREVIGDPTEVALYNFAAANGFEKLVVEGELARVAEIPFDSERKCMTTFHRWPGPQGCIISITKGAVEVVGGRSTGIMRGSGVEALDMGELHTHTDRMAADGLRVLCIAVRCWKELPRAISPEEVEAALTVVGLVGIMDPPREEAASAIALCGTAGIKTVMITGDHPITARAIARRLGLIEDDLRDVMTGWELDKLSAEEFAERVEHIRVYARVAPEQKLKIVKALQDKGQYVAMTGDGVNDAPALKRADIGVAMGITGTDVAKEASDMILVEDNFATIVRAVREGRRIFDNIRKFIKYTMTSNTGEILTIFLAPFFGLPIPLLPIHLLWINLVTDGLPGLALAAEPEEAGVMGRPPRHPKESIFARGIGAHIIWVGLLMAGISVFTQAWSIRGGGVGSHWQTMVFTVLCLSQMGHVFAIRSGTSSLFSLGLFSNMPLFGAVLLTFTLQMATIYVPFLQPIFKTEALTAPELAFTLAMSSVVFFAVEVEKLLKRFKS